MSKANRNERKRDAWYTRPEVAYKVAKWALEGSSAKTILEPSAGAGGLIVAAKMVQPSLHIDALDIKYPKTFPGLLARRQYFGDFLHFLPEETYDMALMNPPFSGGQDLDHVEHATHCAEEVCAIVLSNFLSGKKRYERLWSQVYLARQAHFRVRPNFENGGEIEQIADSARSNFTAICIRRSPDLPERKSGEIHSCTQITWL